MKKYNLILLIILTCFTNVHSQQIKNESVIENKTTKKKKVEISVMPYLSYNRNLDFMFGAIPMLMYKTNQKDTISPKSLSGVSGVYTTNKSYFVALFNRWYFKEDSWRAKFFMFTGDFNSQFYMDDDIVPGFYDYGTEVFVISGGVQRKIIEHLYGGLTYTYAHYDTIYENEVQPEDITETNGIELNMLYDSRDALYYPTKGINSTIKFVTFPTWFGNDVKAQKLTAEYNTYFPMKAGRDVLAARFSGTFGLGDIAFQQQETIGNKDIRGYSEGRYRGNGVIAIQGEYRYNFGEKMGLVGFAGLATLYGSDTDTFNWNVYPGIGAGYRYRAFKTVKFNIGLDAAVGKDDWSINFRIGEAF